MFKQIFILITVLVLLTACAGTPSKIAPEQMQPIEAAAASEPVEKSSDAVKTATTEVKKVCKTYATTGTRFKEKVCRSQEAWEEIERKAKEALDAGTKPQGNNPVGG